MGEWVVHVGACVWVLGLSDNIILSKIAMKFQYWNHEISILRMCKLSPHVCFLCVKMAESDIELRSYRLTVPLVLYGIVLDSQNTMGSFWSQTTSLCSVSCAQMDKLYCGNMTNMCSHFQDIHRQEHTVHSFRRRRVSES